MSLLIQLRQRIKATETTQKTTNAMRLIAMSSHMRFKQASMHLNTYQNQISKAFLPLQTFQLRQQNNIPQEDQKRLVIIIGSQKGLCGTYNSSLATYAQRFFQDHAHNEIVVIGEQMKNTLVHQHIEPAITYKKFNLATINSIAEDLIEFVLSPNYTHVTILSTKPKSFFTLRHQTTNLTKQEFQITQPSALPEIPFLLEQSYEQTYNTLGTLALKSTIQEILVNALLSEASSRFLSMDIATRNADELIGTMKLDYNKLRQASITRELTDLAAVFVKS